MADSDKLARVFKLISAGTRVRIIQLLKRKCLCVNALAHSLGLTPAAVSQHLRVLRDAGVVRAEKRGYFVHYCIDKKVLARWRQAADDMLQA
jgi:ArsR family transcriptional regulator, arsenate/arsenite/antimonite-responsive transcriptional repressor